MVWMGKAQWVPPSWKVWHLLYLECPRKSQCLIFCQMQTIGWLASLTLIIIQTFKWVKKAKDDGHFVVSITVESKVTKPRQSPTALFLFVCLFFQTRKYVNYLPWACAKIKLVVYSWFTWRNQQSYKVSTELDKKCNLFS